MVQHKRSGKLHLVHPDGLATRCGRRIRRGGWWFNVHGPCTCGACLRALMAWAEGKSLTGHVPPPRGVDIGEAIR